MKKWKGALFWAVLFLLVFGFAYAINIPSG